MILASMNIYLLLVQTTYEILAEAPKLINRSPQKDPILITEGQTISFSVDYTGTPKPESNLSKNGEPIKIEGDIQKFTREKNGKKSVDIIIQNAVQEDSGDYTIRVYNSEGAFEATFKVIVKKEKILLSNTSVSNITYSDDWIALNISPKRISRPPPRRSRYRNSRTKYCILSLLQGTPAT